MKKVLVIIATTFTVLISTFSSVFAVVTQNFPVRSYVDNLNMEIYTTGGQITSFSADVFNTPYTTSLIGLQVQRLNLGTSSNPNYQYVICDNEGSQIVTLHNLPSSETTHLTNSEVTYSDTIVNVKYSYVAHSEITFTLTDSHNGYFDVILDLSGIGGYSYRLNYTMENCLAYVYEKISDTQVKYRIYPQGNRVVKLNFYKNFINVSSVSNVGLVSYVSNSLSQDALTTYQLPVKDTSTHTKLDTLINVLNDNASSSQQKVQETNDKVNTETTILTNKVNELDNIENEALTNVDNAMEDIDFNRQIQVLNGTTLSTTANWVGNLLTQYVQQYRLIEFFFMFPLIIGIGLLIIGRVR